MSDSEYFVIKSDVLKSFDCISHVTQSQAVPTYFFLDFFAGFKHYNFSSQFSYEF